MKHLFLTFLSICFFISYGTAQIISGGLRGQIKKGAAVIANAEVQLVNESTGATMHTRTDTRGIYFFDNLTPSEYYKISIRSDQGSTEQSGITVRLGEQTDLDIDVSATELEDVIVSGRRSKQIKNGAATTIVTKTLMQFPTANRSIIDMTALTPQANGFSLAGSHSRFNNISIDGAVANDVFGLGSTALPGNGIGTQPISLDAIKEIQIVLSPYNITYGNFTGGGINAVTRSGTNKLEGSAYLFHKNAALTGKDPVTKKPTDQFSEYTAGLRLGGPLVKNKLFFFTSYEFVHNQRPTLFNAGDPGAAISLANAQNIAQLMQNKYGYDVGSYQGAVNLVRQNHKFLAKLDWQINNHHEFTIRYNFVTGFDNFLTRSGARFSFGNTGFSRDAMQNALVTQLRSTLAPNLFNTLIVSYTRLEDTRAIKGALFPQITLNNSQVNVGSELFAQDNRLEQNIIEITNNLKYKWQNYIFTAGTHNEILYFYNSFFPRKPGEWQLKGGLDELQKDNPSVNRFRSSYIVQKDGEKARFWAGQLSLYAQAEGHYLNDRLSVTLGFRADLPVLFNTPLYNPNFQKQYGLDNRQVPLQPLYSPRLGFNYDVTGKKDIIIRGGAGLFSGRIPFVWISNNFANDGIRLGTIDTRTNIPPFNPDVAQIPHLFGSGKQSFAMNIIDPKFRFPQILRTNFATDIKIPGNVLLTLEGIFTKNLNSVYVQRLDFQRDETGKIAATKSQTVPLTTVSVPRYERDTRYMNADGAYDNNKSYLGGIYLITNNNQGYAYNLTAKLSKTFHTSAAGQLNLMAAYTYTRAFDISSSTASIAASSFFGNFIPASQFFNTPPLATSNYELRHRAIFSASYLIPEGRYASTTLVLFATINSGTPYSLLYANFDLNGDGVPSNDLIYVPNEQDIAASALSEAQKQALKNFVENPALKNQQGQFLKRNSLHLPWSSMVNLRLLQNVILPAAAYNHTLQFSLEIFNLGNLLNDKWGRQWTQGLTGIFNDKGAITRPNASFNDTYNYTFNSRWSIQLGIRYLF